MEKIKTNWLLIIFVMSAALKGGNPWIILLATLACLAVISLNNYNNKTIEKQTQNIWQIK